MVDLTSLLKYCQVIKFIKVCIYNDCEIPTQLLTTIWPNLRNLMLMITKHKQLSM